MKWIWRTIGVIGMVVLASACHQNDTVFAVNTTDDTVDSNPGDGFCNDANGSCSLRAAVMEANALPGVEEIRLADGERYDITRFGALPITTGMVIAGNGLIDDFGQIEVNAPGLVEFDGVDFFNAGIRVEGAQTVVYVTGAEIQGSSGAPYFLNQQDGTVILDSSAIYGDLIEVLGGSLTADNLMTDDRTGLFVDDGAAASLRFGTFFGRVSASFTGSMNVYASILVGGCDGITSDGYNVGETSCILDHPTDAYASRWDIFVQGLPFGSFRSPSGLYFGGDVESAMLKPGGPAHDAGPPTCPLPGEDARGIQRPFGAACDIGATEIRPGNDCNNISPGANLRFCDLTGRDLQGAQLAGAALTLTTVDGAIFDDADLRGVEWYQPITNPFSIDAISLRNADLSDATIHGFAVTILDVSGGDLTGAQLDLLYLSAPGANLSGSSGDYVMENAVGANVQGADLSDVDFRVAVTGELVGTPSHLPDGLGIVGGYIVGPYTMLTGADLASADLSGFDLVGATVDDADLTNADITGGARFAWFNRSTLDGADFSNTSVENTDFNDTSMLGVTAVGTNMRYGIFDGATIVGTDFTNADLTRARFPGALMLWNTFANTICPSGVNSDANGGNCDGQFTFGAPQPPGAPVPEEFQGREAEFSTLGGNE